MRDHLRFLSIILLGVLTVSAGGTAPGPVPVTFGPNINLSVAKHSTNTSQQETTVAVNPLDPQNIVEGNIDRAPNPPTNTFSFTTDGGQTWTFGGPVPLETNSPSAGDPAIAAGADGNFYYSYLEDAIGKGGAITRTDLVVAKSTDGGRTFPTFSVALQGSPTDSPDKDYIGVDYHNDGHTHNVRDLINGTRGDEAGGVRACCGSVHDWRCDGGRRAQSRALAGRPPGDMSGRGIGHTCNAGPRPPRRWHPDIRARYGSGSRWE